MDGIINVYKEQGFTSHDVVAKLRGILHMKKIGHTGTLDPDAEGVLPVCIGKGTKVCSLITDWTKTYEAVMLLGTVTDTLDTSGKVLKVNPVDVSAVQIMEAVKSFEGEYEQIPPMYSALKVNGKKLYELAREGIEVERKKRKVKILSININELNLDDEVKTVTFTVECSKGTYIRSLCDDIGKKLGCGACMQHLTRTNVGGFGLHDSLTLSEIEKLVQNDEIKQYIMQVDEIFKNLKRVTVLEKFDKLIYNGNKFSEEAVTANEALDYTGMEDVRVYDEKGNFIGIYRYGNGVFSPVKMFFTPQQISTSVD